MFVISQVDLRTTLYMHIYIFISRLSTIMSIYMHICKYICIYICVYISTSINIYICLALCARVGRIGIYIYTYIDYIYVYIIGGSRLQWKTCTCIGIKRKEKKEGRGRGQESSPSPPRSCPLPHHTDDAQQHHSASQQPAVAHTLAHARERRGPNSGSTRRPRKVVLVPWPVVPQTKHTDKQRPRQNARLNKERGWETRGGTSKIKEQSSGDGGARSLVLKRTVRRPPESPSRLHVL